MVLNIVQAVRGPFERQRERWGSPLGRNGTSPNTNPTINYIQHRGGVRIGPVTFINNKGTRNIIAVGGTTCRASCVKDVK